jgi:hypothetical protein
MGRGGADGHRELQQHTQLGQGLGLLPEQVLEPRVQGHGAEGQHGSQRKAVSEAAVPASENVSAVDAQHLVAILRAEAHPGFSGAEVANSVGVGAPPAQIGIEVYHAGLASEHETRWSVLVDRHGRRRSDRQVPSRVDLRSAVGPCLGERQDGAEQPRQDEPENASHRSTNSTPALGSMRVNCQWSLPSVRVWAGCPSTVAPLRRELGSVTSTVSVWIGPFQ